MENKIGIEAEYILRDKKGDIIIPPAYTGRDGFPVLGEIRADPGETVVEVVSNFLKAKMSIERQYYRGETISFEPVTIVPLKIYKKAMAIIRDSDGGKDALLSKVMNIHNIDISDYSDQIIKNNKIQGCKASCGLHIHFSSSIGEKRSIHRDEYESIDLPISILDGKAETVLSLSKYTGRKEEETIEVTASQLNKPSVEWIVRNMDDKFFERFVPPEEKDRTKFRQPGFFELKDYGFEYRSLPASPASIESLTEIVEYAFSLLKDLNSFSYRSVN